MVSAVIVAAGKGTRMGPNVDKLFLEVAGKPIVAHTWSRFDASPTIDEIVLVVREGMQPDFEKIARENRFTKPYRMVAGGKERQDSVWNGVRAVSESAEIVAIHDAARPCVTEEIIRNCVIAARETGAAVAASRVTDTVKEVNAAGVIARNIDRSTLRAVQTPQTFQRGVILRALAKVRELGHQVTDDTAACELIGQSVRLVESETPNPKATSLTDLPYLALLLAVE